MCFLLTTLFLTRIFHLLYSYHTVHLHSKGSKTLLRDISTKGWRGHAGVLDDMILLIFPVWLQMYVFIFQHSLRHNMNIGTMCHHSLLDWFLGVRYSGVECHEVFTNSLIEFYFIMIFIMINVSIIGILMAIFTLPGCFRPWTFSLNIGLNMLNSDALMSCLHSLLGYSTGEFQALQLIVLAAFGAVD